MSQDNTMVLIKSLIEEQNEETRAYFYYFGDGKCNYTMRQKEFAFPQVDIYGIRATSRMRQIPMRTIQRWCPQYGKRVK